MAGYSKTPLRKKLGFEPPLDVVVIDPPEEYLSWLGELPEGVRIRSRVRGEIPAAHLFVLDRAALERHLPVLRERLRQAGFIWVSWPKKASKVETDVTEDVVRAVALPLGLVDIKVCAVSDVWSGLKLVIRRELRR
jgi:hypothetical protein